MSSAFELTTQRQAVMAVKALEYYFLWSQTDQRRRCINSELLRRTTNLLLDLLPMVNKKSESIVRQELKIERTASLESGIRRFQQGCVSPEKLTRAVRIRSILGCIGDVVSHATWLTSARLSHIERKLRPLWEHRSRYPLDQANQHIQSSY